MNNATNNSITVIEALSALRAWDIKNGHSMTYGNTASNVAAMREGTLETGYGPSKDGIAAARKDLAKAERQGLLTTFVVRTEGRGSKNTRQTYKMKYYTIKRVAS